MVCDTTGNTVRQGYCYICLAIGGGGVIPVGSLSLSYQIKLHLISPLISGWHKPCFLVNRVFVPLPKRGHLDKNSKNDEFAFYPLKTRASLLRPTKTTKMAGVAQARHGPWFRKSRVCSSLPIVRWQTHGSTSMNLLSSEKSSRP